MPKTRSSIKPGVLFYSLLLLLYFICPGIMKAQENSVLATGNWVKMAFTESGVYRIDAAFLDQAGFSSNDIDPRNIALYGNGGGMLPQPNATSRIQDLYENPIVVTGQSDGVFNQDDHILFYVDHVGSTTYDRENYVFTYEKNLYSDTVYYFLTVKETEGKRLNSLPNLDNDSPPISTYNHLITYENDIVNILNSGREWFGESFNLQVNQEFTFPINNISPNSPIQVSVEAMAQSLGNSNMNVSLNDQSIGILQFSSIPNTQYGEKGRNISETFETGASTLANAQNLTISLSYDKNGNSGAVAYLNQMVINVERRLSLTEPFLHFRSTRSLDNGISSYALDNATAETQVWDITNAIDPNLQLSSTGTQLTFGSFSDELREYIAFNPSQLPSPTHFTAINNQNLHALATPDLLIISHPDFITEANRLASFRTTHDGLAAAVVDINQVYNEFSSGAQDISAIRDFVRFLHQKNDRLKYLLLFGKGSYDYKERVSGNTNFVPTYESRNSLHPLGSFSSDDYFGFLEEEEGEWTESTSGDHTLDIGIGRIPVTTIQDARVAVNKIIRYQTAPEAFGNWRSKVLFLADDGDNNLHQRDADQLATSIDTTYEDFRVEKLYLDAFKQERLPSGETSPEAEAQLLREVEEGALIINFTGHGSETRWMHEGILSFNSIDEWDNTYRLPLLVTATCEFGRNDDPATFSGAEKILLKENGGAIALLTTARPVFSSTNFRLNQAFYADILQKQEGDYQRLGDITRLTKNNSLSGSANRNFILLGDPSMRLNYPEKEIRLSAIDGKMINGSSVDTLRALQKFQLEGYIGQGEMVDNEFSGTLFLTLFDKEETSRTKGTENSSVFEFRERKNVLFRGAATIENGQFEINAIIPKNINYQWGSGKFSLYAVDTGYTEDALGANLEFVIGGTVDSPDLDSTPPEIMAYLDDTTEMQQNPVVDTDATLFLRLFDINGINISGSGIGQEITASLNDSVTYILNDLYTADVDNYQRGWVRFPLTNLPSGNNQLTIRAWDSYNNSTTVTFPFVVSEGTREFITSVKNYPNPFEGATTFSIEHRGAGEEIEFNIEIYNSRGEHIITLTDTKINSSAVENYQWDGINKHGVPLEKGIYLYRVILRQINDPNTHFKHNRLVISN